MAIVVVVVDSSNFSLRRVFLFWLEKGLQLNIEERNEERYMVVNSRLKSIGSGSEGDLAGSRGGKRVN